MAINTSGTPSTANYVLGRGVVYISPLVSGAPTGYIDLGNAPSFSSSIDVEELLHQSSRTGTRVTDKRVIISRTVSLALTIDEITHDNLALFYVGSIAEATNPARAADIGTVGSPNTAVTFQAANWSKARWYDMVNGSGARFSLATSTGVTIVADAGGTPVTLTEGTDYVLDRDLGRIFIPEGSSAVTTVTLGVIVDSSEQVSANARASIQTMEALKGTNNEYAVKFVMENPANADEPLEFEFHSVQLAADGELALIGEEFTSINLSGTAQVDDNGDTLTITGLSPT